MSAAAEFWTEELATFPRRALGPPAALWVAALDGDEGRGRLRLILAHAWGRWRDTAPDSPGAAAGPPPVGGRPRPFAPLALVEECPAPPLGAIWRAIESGLAFEGPWRAGGDAGAGPRTVREGRAPRALTAAGGVNARPCSAASTLWIEPLRCGDAWRGAFALLFDDAPPWGEAVRLWGARLGARLAPLLDRLPAWPPAAARTDAPAGEATLQPTLFPLAAPRLLAQPAPPAVRHPGGGLALPKPHFVPGVPGAVGVSAEFRACCERALAVAAAPVNVLLQGESGVGKEIIARAVHLASARREGAFLGQNCAALPESLFESELFGHRAGAFTGAASEKVGLLEAANGGTFFLDEIGDMPLALQIKLLRVMQERRVRRIGELDSRPVDIRWIAATHKDLEQEIAAGRFRLDLFYRLKVVRLTIPPLRRRPEDIPHLLAYFLRRQGGRRAPTRITEEALAALQAHRWPGNVRELENEAGRLLALHPDEPVVRLGHLSAEVQRTLRPSVDPNDLGTLRPLDQATELLERYLIRKAVGACNGSKAAAARRLGLSRQGLYKKIRRYGLIDLLHGFEAVDEAAAEDVAVLCPPA